MSDFHGAIRDHPVYRRQHQGIRQIQTRLIQRRLLQLSLRLRRLGTGTDSGHLLRTGGGRPNIGLRLQKPCLCLFHLVVSSGGKGSRRIHRGCASLGGGQCLVILLLRNLLLVDQLFIAHQVSLRFHVIGLSFGQLRLGGRGLLPCGQDPLLSICRIGLGA